MTYKSIKPGQIWLDTNGNRIQAHGGSIIYVDDTFYWYGENKEKSKENSGIWHWGVRCYSSKDLYNWEDLGLIVPPDSGDEDSPLHPSKYVDRPHIIYNQRTRKYVCWLKIMGEGNTQESTILVADSILGPYTIVQTGLRPLGMNAGDFDLVVSPDDGKAYYYFERVHSELICADLSDDYTGVTGYYSTHFPNGHPPYVREAPAYFRRKGLHYLLTSGTTGYFPNPSEVACAQSYHGPWTIIGNPHPDDSTLTSYRSQISSVFKHPHKKDLYIALADRWLPNNTVEGPEAMASFAVLFGEEQSDQIPDAINLPAYPDTSIADYVWLPIRFDGEMVYLDWKDEWRIEDYH
ncbi:MAG: family 43 glycosylhydrolase [Anaerolineaceae bacterium]|nr:family 43 glycosylhydrolase [Anaerolineaceae bacterium]